jgi:hypothetical protein
MPAALIRQFASPPRSPKDCVFALTTQVISADLKTKVVPCQFGGNPRKQSKYHILEPYCDMGWRDALGPSL